MNLIQCRILLFANLAESVGARSVAVALSAPATVSDALDTAAEEYPVIAEMRDHLAVAMGDCYVTSDHTIEDGDEIALIPPVSGG